MMMVFRPLNGLKRKCTIWGVPFFGLHEMLRLMFKEVLGFVVL